MVGPQRATGMTRAALQAAAVLALCTAAYALTYEFAGPVPGYRFGAAAWPRALIVLIAVAALGHLAAHAGWLGRRHALVVRADAADDPAASPAGGGSPVQRAVTFALPVAYLLLLPGVGYYVLTPFFLAALMFALGERRPVHLVGTSLLVHAAVVLAFTKVFFIQFPVGIWPGFHAVGVRLLEVLQ